MLLFKGDWVHFQGKQLCHFHFCLLQLGSTLKEKEQILSCKNRPYFGWVLSSREASKRTPKIVLPLKKVLEDRVVCDTPYTD